MRKLVFTMLLMWSFTTWAQTTITGTITDSTTGEPIPGASVRIVGKELGTTADFDGMFTLKVSENPPFTLECSSIGYQSETAQISSAEHKVDFKLQESAETLDEVVVSASRTPERIRESPVTIERIDAKIIQNAATPDFYDGLENLKGVDINTNSLTFKSINTRGFATFANARFMQLVDGMDNTSPALNFALGNLLGMNELDVNTVEILPGASSALYGANAFNGILFMTSKSPFDDQGISTYFKTGMTIQEVAGDNEFYDLGIRAAYKFHEKVAAKANFSFLKGTDWMAADYNMYEDGEIGKANVVTPFDSSNPGFDAMNVYGDEVATVLNYDAILNVPVGTFGSQQVARTGYKDTELMDYKARSVKADFALHYKPWANDKEVIFNYRVGKGNTIYQGANRYYIKDFIMDQMKLEFKGDNFFIRGYRTSENAGDSYDSRFAAINMNRMFKGDVQWFTDYATGYLGLLTGQALMDPNVAALAGALGLSAGNVDDANTFARMLADNLTPFGAINPTLPSFAPVGTTEFTDRFNEVVSDPNLSTGARFADNSKVHHVDANYSLTSLIENWADLQVGGSYRKYTLNSSGTIFTDYDGPINYNEYGAYTQLSKKFADDRLKFTGSLRYDKAQNFDGAFSPRVAFVYSVGENLRHNLRASFQTGFRNPTTQDQYIGLDAGRAILVGSAPDNIDRYTSRPIALSDFGASVVGQSSIAVNGSIAYSNSFSYSSLLDFGDAVEASVPVIMEAYPGISVEDAKALAAAQNASILKKSDVQYVQPEKVSAFELGYRGKVGKLNLDISGYFNQYDGFIATKTVVAPLYGDIASADFNDVQNSQMAQLLLGAIGNEDLQPFQVYTNSAADISSYGGTLGLSTRVDKFNVGLNYTYAQFNFDQDTDPDYEAGFNTPEHKVKFSVGTDELFDNFGFGLNVRWQDEFLWQSSIADAMVPSRTVLDAQINYKVPSIKSVFKVGGANIGGKDYVVAPGTGKIGQQYFVSWTINQ
jgi:outer membrane receptor protein involved in Fe transport